MRSKAETRSDVASEDNWTFLSALYQMVTFFTAKVHNTYQNSILESEIRLNELNFIFIQKTSKYVGITYINYWLFISVFS